MTAHSVRRRRRTVTGAVIAVVLVAVASVLVIVGASTVVNSKAGEQVVGEARPVVRLPETDNAALAVINDDNQLTSLIIATLTPSGVGGSIVTIPVNADESTGFGDTRRPIDAEIDLDAPEALFASIEALLAISLQFGEIVSTDRLATFIAPVVPIEATFPVDVTDPAAPDDGVVVAAGDVTLDGPGTVGVLQARSDSGVSYDHHGDDVEVWSALAANAPVDTGVEVAVDEFDRPVTSATIDELFSRLWQGPVQVRDLALQPSPPADGLDSVVIDRYDALLVFAQISPSRVSTPNPGLRFRIELPYTEAQIDAGGDVFETRSSVGITIIQELLFLAANVVSVDSTARSEGAAAINRIEVSDERFIPDMERLVDGLFGESEIVVAENLIDGVDVVLTLGTSYIDLHRELQAAAPLSDAPQDSVPADSVPVDSVSPGSVPGDSVEPTTDGDTVTSDG